MLQIPSMGSVPLSSSPMISGGGGGMSDRNGPGVIIASPTQMQFDNPAMPLPSPGAYVSVNVGGHGQEFQGQVSWFCFV
jgi:hypothetical protein